VCPEGCAGAVKQAVFRGNRGMWRRAGRLYRRIYVKRAYSGGLRGKIRGRSPGFGLNCRAGSALGRVRYTGTPNPRSFPFKSNRRGQPLPLAAIPVRPSAKYTPYANPVPSIQTGTRSRQDSLLRGKIRGGTPNFSPNRNAGAAPAVNWHTARSTAKFTLAHPNPPLVAKQGLPSNEATARCIESENFVLPSQLLTTIPRVALACTSLRRILTLTVR
jgi:hypothetical protein